jgi:hypothetical protein
MLLAGCLVPASGCYTQVERLSRRTTLILGADGVRTSSRSAVEPGGTVVKSPKVPAPATLCGSFAASGGLHGRAVTWKCQSLPRASNTMHPTASGRRFLEAVLAHLEVCAVGIARALEAGGGENQHGPRNFLR